MLAPLAKFGPDRTDVRTLGQASFGRVLDQILPEDAFDCQPLTGQGGRVLFCADVRIDNRAELAAELGLPPSRASRMSDAQLLLGAWEKWRVDCFKHFLGDAAMAVWEADERRLTVARTAASLRPLVYHQGAGFVAFASLPDAIFALPEVPKKLDVDEAAAIIGGLVNLGSSTMFDGIRIVRHGHAVELILGGERIIRHWHPENIVPGSFRGADWGEAMRAELDRSVAAQLRRSKGGVAAQLSSGRDSSAVATSAALEQARRGEPLIALTGAPMIDFSAPAMPHRLADESQLAALTAARYPNITHFICRPEKGDVASELRDATRHHFVPLLGLGGLHWTTRVAQQAAAEGATVMLIGSTGNFSISAGGPRHLVDLLKFGGARPWWREARRLGGLSLSTWRTVANFSLGPFVPHALYRTALRATGRDQRAAFAVPVLRQPLRRRSEAIIADFYADRRPPRNYYEFRHKILLKRDNAEKLTEAMSGLDVRDPTADRRLIELCLSFPPEALVSADAQRPAYAAAFGDRIPAEVLHSTKRGRQGADWFELFPKDEVSQLFRHFGRNSTVANMFDLDYIQRRIASWPTPGTGDSPEKIAYQNEILGALAMADFIDLHFPD